MLTKEKFEQVFKEYYPSLRMYALRYVLSIDKANDIVQDVFFNLWKIKDGFVIRESMKSYLFSAVYYRCLNYIKHEKQMTLSDQLLSEPSEDFRCFYMDNAINYRDGIFSDDSAARLKAYISELPEQCRRIFILSRKFGLKNREIAEFLEISKKVVEKQLSKALMIIRGKF
jgi:RNA polymerase sigma-70 factor (family 1)